MSTQRGNALRTRSQKYKNRTVFKNDLHDKTDQQKRLNAMHVSEVCQHCKGVIEWKIKYKKYKPLKQPKTCTRCQQRTVRKAYHVLCRNCALETRNCAKCLKSADEVEIEPPGPTPEEEVKLKVEMERLIKSFPERKRRAFLRYMDKGKKQEAAEEAEINEKETETTAKDEETTEDEKKDITKQKPPRIPHSRDELLQKIEQLKLTTGDESDFDDDDEDFDSDDFEDSEEYDSEESS